MMDVTHHEKNGGALCGWWDSRKKIDLSPDPFRVDCYHCQVMIKDAKKPEIKVESKTKECNAHGCYKEFIPLNKFQFNCGCLHAFVEYF